MRMREWPGAAMAPLLVIGAVLFPTVAVGQVVLGQLIPPGEMAAAKPPDGFYITPSLSIGELYDDNLFFTSTNRKQDFFTRVSPGIQAGYQSAPLTLLGGYTSDSEFYSRHTELTTLQMRQRALFDLKAMPNSLLTLSAKGTYIKTRVPWELNTFTGIALTRVRADRLALDPSVAYRFDPITKATGDFTISRDSMVGFVSTQSYLAQVGLDRELTPKDTITPGYIVRHFKFEGIGAITSHVPMLGWKHEFTPLTAVTLRAGPRFIEGSLDNTPEALVAIEHKLKHGEVALTYSNVQTTVVGQRLSVIAQSVGLTARYELLPHFEVAIAPNAVWVTSDSFTSTVYFSNVELTYQLSKELALKGSHQYALMKGNFSPSVGPVESTAEVPHNMFWLRLVVTYPFRVD